VNPPVSRRAVAGLALGAVLLVLLHLPYAAARVEHARLERDGVDRVASVTAVGTTYGRRGLARRHVEFTVPDPDGFSGRAGLEVVAWLRAERTEQVVVRVLSPELWRVEGQAGPVGGRWFALVVVADALVLLGAVAVVLHRRRASRDSRPAQA
jgi:hypothetical protein